MRIHSRTENHKFSPGMGKGLHSFVVRNYTAELDDEVASRIVLTWPQLFRTKPWPESMQISTGPAAEDANIENPDVVSAEVPTPNKRRAGRGSGPVGSDSTDSVAEGDDA